MRSEVEHKLAFNTDYISTIKSQSVCELHSERKTMVDGAVEYHARC